MKRTLVDQAPFEFSARVTLQLGRESISSSTVAISELIKNSYDADSESVDIDFYIRRNAVSTLVIKDNGDGMSKADLIDKWLTVGTDNKSTYAKTKSKNRIVTGAKGLGRLGIDRLCKKLILYTKTQTMDHAIQLEIDWHRYEHTSKRLSEITHNIYEVELPIKDKYGDVFSDSNDCGTRMVLIGLKDDWNDEFLDALENELRLLVSPFHSQNEFAINLSITQDKFRVTKKLSSEDILNLALWKVVAETDTQGNIRAHYVNQEKNISIIEDPIPWREWIKNSGNEPKFGPVKLEFYYIPEKGASLKQVNLRKKDFQDFMKLNRGVRIYRDHFRVRPYGEPSGKGDWLDIGYRKASSPGGIAQGGWRVGPNQILGSVLISRTTNSILNDQANREGIVENDAFFQLRTFVLKVIDTFERYAHKDAASDKEVKISDVIAAELEEAQKSSNEAARKLTESAKTQPKKRKNKKSPTFNQLISRKIAVFEKAHAKQKEKEQLLLEALEAEKKELQEQKDTLANLASLGILTVCFGHEIRQHTAQASGDTALIEYLIEDSVNQKREINIPDLHEHTESIRKSVNYIENYSKLTLSNIKPDKRTRKKVNIPTVFRYVFELLNESFTEMGIKQDIIFSDLDESHANVRSFEIDWESIAINLITNSIWAMDNSRQGQRKIEVEFKKLDESEFEIRFRDSGVGLEEGSEEHIFMPMKSGKRDRTGNTIGTGMGLSIVKNHIEDHAGGSIEAKKTSSLGGAEFIFTLPFSK